MSRIETWFDQDLKKPVIVRRLENVFNQDALGNLIGVRVFSDGSPVNLSGSITGYCVLADGSTVPVAGTRSQNKAYITLPPTAYSVPGLITIAIKNTDGSAITTLCACAGIVAVSRTGVQVDPGSTVTDWTNQISAALQQIEDIVLVQDTQPSSSSNKIWIKETPESEIVVPTYDEYSDLKSALGTLDSEIIYQETYKNTGTDQSIWRTSRPITDPENLYVCLVDKSGVTAVTPLKFIVGYTTGSAVATYVNNVGEFVKVITDPSRTFSYVNVQLYRSDSAVSSATESMWEYLVVRGEPNKNRIIELEIYNPESLITMADFDGQFRMGSINGGSNPPTWNATSEKYAVTRQEMPFSLNAGDKIYLTNYTNAQFRVVSKIGSTWAVSQYVTNGTYGINSSGLYWVEICNNPAAKVSNMNDLIDLIRVVKRVCMEDYVKNELVPFQRMDWHVKSINHRGMNLIAPENTLPAFKMSAQLGWKYVETDIAQTSDGVIVLLHDSSINRTARNADGTAISGTVNIADITYEQALTYDFGIWKGTQYAGTKIPTLEQFLALCRKLSICPYLDFGSFDNQTLAENVAKIVIKYGMRDKTTYVAANPAALGYVKAIDNKARLGLIAASASSSVLEAVESLKTEYNEVFLDCSTAVIDSSLVETLADALIPLECYTPNDVTQIIELNKYITGVTSDYFVAGKVLFDDGMGS